MQTTPNETVPSLTRHDIYVHAVETLIALAVAFVAWRLVLALIDRLFAPHTEGQKSRASTYVDPLKSVISFVVVVVLVLVLLDIWQVDVTSAVWGAGAVTAALAFGAQALVRDWLAGYAIFTQDQFEIGDYVELTLGVGGIVVSGIVVGVGIRTTRLIDKGGRTLFIPNGNIYAVTNGSKARRRIDIKLVLPWCAGANEMQDGLRGIVADAATAISVKSEEVVIRLEDFDAQQATYSVSMRAPESGVSAAEDALRTRIAQALQAKGWLPGGHTN